MANSAIVIGAGIVGIATTYHLLKKGYTVTVLEKTHLPIGASIRNFGMIWPIGQPLGDKYDLALASKKIWMRLSKEAGFHLNLNGSIHLAYHKDEKNVLEEFIESNVSMRSVQWLSTAEAYAKSKAINPIDLLGGMYSNEEALVDPREAVLKLALYIASLPGCTVHFDTPVYSIEENICKGPTGQWQADKIFVCSGSDIAMLYPGILHQHGTLCELQMMRTGQQPSDYRIGPSLCAGLTLAHYGAFKNLSSLDQLLKRLGSEHPALIEQGIHVMAAQNEIGEVTIGDSHAYASHFDPFIRQDINDNILNYLKTFCIMPDTKIQSYWKGTYFKLKNGDPYLIYPTSDYTTIVNGFGGLGMTLSFGAMEKIVSNL